MEKIPEPLHGHGQIYQIKNKENGKLYVGQVCNFTDGNRLKGAIGRFKEHILTAEKNITKCYAISRAIRKYGKENFELSVLEHNIPFEKLNEKEEFYIKKLNSLKPNGYNLIIGASGKNGISDETKEKLKNRKGHIFTEEQINHFKISICGKKRNDIKKKNSEDNLLPKYICCIRKKEKIIGYNVNSYPIGITEKKIIRKTFKNSENPDEALVRAKKFLAELDEKYKNIDKEIKEYREKHNKEYNQKILLKNNKKKLPEYIFPILKNNQIMGFYVEKENIPKKEFTSNSGNYFALENAKNYLNKNLIKIKDKEENFVETYDKLKYPNINYDETNKPINFKILYDVKEKIGYFAKIIVNKNKIIQKTFDSEYELMSTKFHKCMEFINLNSHNNNLFIENIDYNKYPNIKSKNNLPRNVSIVYNKNKNKIGYKFFRCLMISNVKNKIQKSFINADEKIEDKWEKCLEFTNNNHKTYPFIK